MKNKFLDKVFESIINVVNKLLRIKEVKTLVALKKVLCYINCDLIYLVEGGKWSIYWDGKFITDNLNRLNYIKSFIDTKLTFPWLIKNKLIHYGSIHCLISKNGIINVHKSNKNILTWFHFIPENKFARYIPYISNKLEIIHTSSIITKNHLINYVSNKNQITVIPLGVDLSIFRKYSRNEKINLRKRYNLPLDKIIIGSFQKDGVGWGEGSKPKFIKGPDIFCEVVKKLNEDFDIHIFLTGPARGYVKQKLQEYRISYTHYYLQNYLDLVECYNTLDLYIISSRAEGGPKALLEGMATGVPLITTNVGMVPQIIKHGENALVSEIEDIQSLYELSKIVLEDNTLRNKLVSKGLKKVQELSWENIAKRYYNKIYKKLKI